jgi:acyl-lipid omega-6 desaturase (Delta-12 desaturase)
MSLSQTAIGTGSARALAADLARYRGPRTMRSAVEIAITAGPLLSLWVVAMLGVARGEWLALILIIPAAGFLVRLFMIQHDCGHGSFFPDKRVNDWVGRVLGVVTLTPYEYWRRTHAIHHATSGALDRRGLGAIEMLTVEEYRSRGPLGRFLYRLYRNPLVLFGIGPAYMFLLQQRLPIGLMRAPWAWASAMGANLGIVALVAGGIWLFGAAPFLIVYVPTLVVGGAIGIWLFFVQHQFEETHWAKGEAWDLHEAALKGSSHYDLPPLLRWFTANIGVHHVHHLNSRIPYYRLPEVLRDHPELKAHGRLTLRDSLRCVPLALWDERQGRLVAFRDLQSHA